MAPWELCSKEDVMSIHPIAESEIKDTWSEMVEDMIREHKGMPYLGTTQAITDEYHDGDGSYILKVNKPPIDSVQSLTVNSIQLSASDYVIFRSYIELKGGLSYPRGILNVKVSYTSGDLNISGRVRLCAAAMIVALINYKKRHGADGSIKWATNSEQHGEQTPNRDLGLAQHLKDIMHSILKRGVRVR